MATAINSKGIRHPNTFSLSRGKTLYSSEIDSINQSIRLILTTAKGELFGDPDFGSNLYKYLYDYQGPELTNAVKEEIINSLNTYEPRIFVELDDITAEVQNKTLVINISYNLRYTDYRTVYQYITSIKED